MKRYGNLLFTIGYAIYITYFVLFSSTLPATFHVNSLGSFLNIIAILFILCSILLSDKSPLMWGFCIISIILGIIFYFTSGDSMILIFCIFIAGGITVKNIRNIIKVDFIIRSLTVIFIILINKTHLISSIFVYRNDGFVRDSLGFSHPNTFGAFIMLLIMDWILLRYNRLKYLDVFFFILIAYILKIISDPRASVIAIIVSVILIVIFKIFKNNLIRLDIAGLIMSLIYPIFAIVSYVAVFLYAEGNLTVSYINDFLSGRITLMSNYLVNYGISIFGQRVRMFDSLDSGGTYTGFIDNTYMSLLIRYGLVALLLFCILYFFLTIRTFRNHNYALLIVLISLASFGLMEATLIYPAFNLTCVLLLNLRTEENLQ
ncbi:hypothetical protein [Latilactobacillus fuchuensis]|uniref:Polysaccharide polymerase n=1 Tax=Latilactobacillus fuchuensis DSM 14340 = JCM 11249 TaxID=1423747 RepID=A0A0R1RQD5_9LACO|nr:hypothetical protein [Latilactobacillus fuchuensis]KRL59287.1 hypothetical protein FC69_GL001726 [Latilactobacillus fuchuensis DSM 14340 = JCM 11249]